MGSLELSDETRLILIGSCVMPSKYGSLDFNPFFLEKYLHNLQTLHLTPHKLEALASKNTGTSSKFFWMKDSWHLMAKRIDSPKGSSLSFSSKKKKNQSFFASANILTATWDFVFKYEREKFLNGILIRLSQHGPKKSGFLSQSANGKINTYPFWILGFFIG